MQIKEIIKSLILSLVVMGIVSVLSLLLVSALTYMYKWQAPQAMVGITLTYIITGILGGVIYGILKHGCLARDYREGTPTLREHIIDGGLLGCIYVVLLFMLALILADGASIEYERWFSVMLLVVCSTIFGHFFSDVFYKNG